MRKLKALLVLCFALFFASTVQCQTNTGANNAELNGNYAFTFSGITGGPGYSVVFAAVGRFTADGAGNITDGLLDTNGIGAGAVLVNQSFTGSYSIGADKRGVMTLDIPGGAKLTFAMTANGNAQFIEFDATGGTGTIGSGTMEKVESSAYSTSRITGDYAFGVGGLDDSNNRTAIAGRFTSNGAGVFTNGTGDVNAAGTPYSMTFTAANYAVSDTAAGRGTIHMPTLIGGAPRSLNFVFYVVNAGKLFAMESDAVSPTTPLLNGMVLRQHIPSGGFSDASLNGDMVIYLTGLSVCGNAAGSAPDVLVGLLTGDGNGALSMSADQNCGGSRISSTGLFGTYSVAGSGRTSITAGTASAVAYLVSSNTAFIVADGGAVLFGFGEPQTAGSFSNSTLKGTYAGLATTPATFDVVVFSGEFAADGASPTGDMTGAEDIGAPSGPLSDVAFKATYSVASSPTDGRGAMTVTSGTGGSAVIYMISASKFVAASLSDQNPSVLIFELSSPPPPPPTVSLSSLALNPTSVTGGNSSKGIVTLSGPAPGGGALVMLSSSSTAAKAPTSVTVVAGATTATFTVNTSAVTASTTATISASYAGVTETASLTVTPAPPPPPAPTLSSLTLNPSSVIGGVQSSTGQVTLTAPAPAGGATVMLSASNGAARVPSSVFVPAGATSATFTVNTSIVLLSTSVTISASYNGTTRRATLSVLL